VIGARHSDRGDGACRRLLLRLDLAQRSVAHDAAYVAVKWLQV